jgi:two-component system phosphate regulon sensor histidine kinase PhoR
MVDLSKLEADKVSLTLEAVNLVDVVQKARDHKVQATPVELAVSMPASLPPVRGDRDRLGQMISNLLSFVLQIQNEGQIAISATYDEQYATIRVAAAGLFLPADELAELFDLTVKVDASGGSKLGKGGLTLPLVQRLAQKHQGQLWVEGEANMGTAFYLKLPLDQSN